MKPTTAIILTVALSLMSACGGRGISKKGPTDSNADANGSTNSSSNNQRSTNSGTNNSTVGPNAATNSSTSGGRCDGVTCAPGQQCVQGACDCLQGRLDCDGDPANGCESTGACTCTPGDTRSCYSGPADTRGVGACSDGVQTCNADGTAWSACDGDQLPEDEVCGDSIDNDCDGETDGADEDGDGFSVCDGDCCDSAADGCDDPELVNPGAYDFADGVDNDCDGLTDNPPECSATQKWSGANARQLANAMGVCTPAGPAGWGLVEATLAQSHGAGTPGAAQRAVALEFGSTVQPVSSSAMAILSTGTAAGLGDPGYEENFQAGTSSTGPADYLAAHGGSLPDVADCSVGSPPSIHDSVMLRLTLRAPVNARGLQVDYRYFSLEYPTWLCTQFNDFFLMLVDSTASGLPADGNIARDPVGNPITVNSDVITTCQPTSCTDTCSGERSCVDQICEGDRGACPHGDGALAAVNENLDEAGATSWLRSTTPVVGGETLTVEFHIWDTGDEIMESWVLLDSLRWLESAPPVQTGPIP